jgi:hypothetical protein
MKYTKEVNDFEKALGLGNIQATRIRDAIQKAYSQEWHMDGANVDQINALVAPELHTPEEAFYAATVILSDVFGAMWEGLHSS